MNGRLVVVAAVIGGLVLGLLVLLGGGADEGADGATQDSVAGQRAAAAGLADTDADGATAAIASDRFRGDPETPAVAEATTKERQSLRGSVTVDTASGLELSGLDGELVLRVFGKEWGDETKVRVMEGQWECLVGEYSYVRVIKCVLMGRPIYFPHEQQHQDKPADGFLELRGVRGETLGLSVVDARTGADLQNVSLFRNCRWNAWNTDHPGDLADAVLMLTDGVSPLTVDPPEILGDPKVKCWVIAPGYAWGKLGFDHSSGGERAVELHDGGALEVRVGGKGRAMDTLICLRSLDGGGGSDGVKVEAAATGTTTIGGVRVGSYELTLEKGDWFGERLVLGRARAGVRKGETVIVEVDTAAAPSAPPKVAVQGTLTLPAVWPRSDVALHLVPKEETEAWVRKSRKLDLSAMDAVAGSSERFNWSFDAVVAGTYEAIVSPMGVNTPVTISEAGERNVNIVVPDAADVEVTVRDGATGSLVDPSTVELRVINDSPGFGSFERVELVETGRFRLRAPAGTLRLSAMAEGYDWSVTNHVVGSGRNVVDVPLSPACGLTFVLKDGEATVLFEWDWVRLQEVDGEGRSEVFSGTRVSVTNSGTYRITWKAIPGFKPVPPQDVFIPPGTWVPVVIQLKR